MIISCMPKGADVNRMHGTLKPLHCACMVADADCVELLLEKGAEVCHGWLLHTEPFPIVYHKILHEFTTFQTATEYGYDRWKSTCRELNLPCDR